MQGRHHRASGPGFNSRISRLPFFLDPESESSESDNSNKSSEDESVDSSQSDTPGSEGNDVHVIAPQKTIQPIKVGEFIGVEYSSERKSKKIFIAQVTDIEDDECLLEVVNMRRCGKTNMFVFSLEEKCWIDGKSQAKFKLDQATVDQRERYTFPNLPDNYLNYV